MDNSALPTPNSPDGMPMAQTSTLSEPLIHLINLIFMMQMAKWLLALCFPPNSELLKIFS
jgi:hypothetical protein